MKRRTILEAAGFAAGALAVGGWSVGAAPAAETAPAASAELRLSRPLVAWVVLDLDKGGLVRLVEVDQRSQPVRTIATETLPLMPPASAAQRAQQLAVGTVAAAWGVRPDSCVVELRRIAHPASGRRVAFAVWTDFA